MTMQKEKLIEEVRKYSCLYDLSDSKYGDSIKKDEAWKQIGITLNQPVSECKKIWLNLRESHRRAIKKKKTKYGQVATTTKKWSFEDEMSFLLPHYKEKQTISTITDTSNFEEHDSSDLICSVIDDDFRNSTNTTQFFYQSNVQPEAYVSTVERPESSASSATPNPPSKTKKRANENDSASAALMKYIIEQKNDTQDDEIDKFFKSIAATVKKFSEYNQAVIKSKIYNLVSDMELKEITEKQNYYGYGNPYMPEVYNTNNHNQAIPTTSSTIHAQDGASSADVHNDSNDLSIKKENNCD